MKNFLITGASGALGRAVVKKVNQLEKFNIFTTSRQPLNIKTNITCDVSIKTQLLAALELSKPDIILHLAASFSANLSEAYAVNVESAKNILDYVKNQASNTRVILIGSASEYGVVEPEENPIREDRALAPVSAYGVSKAWQTQLMSMYSPQVDVVCARIFNLYGEGISDRLFYGRFANQLVEVLTGKKGLIETGPLSSTRDYISTDHAAEQLLDIINYGKRGKVYHVASGVPITMRDFAIQQLQAHGLDSSILKESTTNYNRKDYDVPMIFADITQTNQLKKGLT